MMQLRPDLQAIADMVAPGSRVLDIGCGEGELLNYLAHEKQVDGRGIELSVEGVSRCVGQGLSVIQGDADTDLRFYPDQAFDYAILSQTIQATRQPKEVLANLARIAKKVVISIPNFGHWRNRLYLLVNGRMPVTRRLPYQWYDTPNIHFCTIRDFVVLCEELGLTIEHQLAVSSSGKVQPFARTGCVVNWVSQQGVFLLSRSV